MPHHDPISTSAGYLSDIGIQLLRSGTVTGATVLVELIWSNPFGLASIMFLVNRYAPFVDTFLSVNMSFNPAITAEQCAIQTRAVSWLMTIGIVHSELILMLRTYALWGRRRSILILLTFLAVCMKHCDKRDPLGSPNYTKTDWCIIFISLHRLSAHGSQHFNELCILFSAIAFSS
ncbi:hypothetical protein EV360DRAFT_70055 [Lentinula raphanica]|nr:hypothetical protein EV360DRAFT_70055 [Lentinula raphanica]